jgi:hypothetical protein
MKKKIVELIESEDVKNAADEAKQSVAETNVSPEGMAVANASIEPLNAEDAVSLDLGSTASDTLDEVGARTRASGQEVLPETVKITHSRQD